MKKLPAVLGLMGLAAMLTAHPMGNFSVNHYARIEVAPGGAEILFVLDLAELPSFELMQKWGMSAATPRGELKPRAVAEARGWVKLLKITADGRTVIPVFEGAELVISDGAGGLPVMRVNTRLRVEGVKGQLEYADSTYPERTSGWKEVVVIAKGGATIEKTSAGLVDKSQALTAYPQDPTIAPPQDLAAQVTFAGGAPGGTQEVISTKQVLPKVEIVPVPAPALLPVPPPIRAPESKTGATVRETGSAGSVKRGDFLSRAMQQKELGWGFILICLAVAFWFGALHALEPGHGKTMVAAYLVGERGTAKHALFLGAMVTFTHTVSVFVLGLFTIFLSQYIMPDVISKWLGIISGLTIVWIGGMLLYRRAIALSQDAAHAHTHSRGHSHSHRHGNSHAHSHGGLPHSHGGRSHSHVPEGEISMKSLMALGASGGLVPCPSALVLLLSAISFGRTGFGLLLLISFSLGLALVLMATGLLVLYAKNLFPKSKSGKENPVFRIMPVVSAAVIFLIGIVLTGNAMGVIPVMRFFG